MVGVMALVVMWEIEKAFLFVVKIRIGMTNRMWGCKCNGVKRKLLGKHEKM